MSYLILVVVLIVLVIFFLGGKGDDGDKKKEKKTPAPGTSSDRGRAADSSGLRNRRPAPEEPTSSAEGTTRGALPTSSAFDASRLFVPLEDPNRGVQGDLADAPESPQDSRNTSRNRPEEPPVIASIDLGTRYSSFCYNLRGYQDINVFSDWGHDAAKPLDTKVPTSVLLDKDENFKAFGDDAIHIYLDEKDESLLFFENFKMILYNTWNRQRKLDSNLLQITAANGKKVLALKVFTVVLTYLKGKCLMQLKKATGVDRTEKDIRWIMTVPAIWDNSAKFFMRKAAFQAGLFDETDPKRLIIALEPEAAALYCRSLPVGSFRRGDYEQLDPETRDLQEFNNMAPGDKYVVIDCGGGTLDMTAHQVVTGGVIEVERASGGDHGGAAVDRQFVKLLERLFTPKFVKDFRGQNVVSFQQILQNFEDNKRRFSPSSQHPRINVDLSYEFADCYEKKTGETVEAAINRAKAEQGLDGQYQRRNKLRLLKGEVQKLFKPVVDEIRKAILEFLSREGIRGTQIFFLVGGFAPCVRDFLSDIMSDFQCFDRASRILVPQETTLAVLKGAVLYGLNPGVIKQRIVRETYGIGVSKPFEEARGHTIDKKFPGPDGKHRCKDILQPVIRIGERVSYSQVATLKVPTFPRDVNTVLLYSTQELPHAGIDQFIDDENCKQQQSLLIKTEPNPSGRYPKVEVLFQVGGSELQISAVNQETREEVYTEICFTSY